MSEHQTLGRQFDRFTVNECQHSPLYRALASQIARDEELLGLAARGTAGPKPNLFLAAVHYLLLNGAGHRLAAYYPTISESPVESEGVFPCFRDFCLEQKDSIRRLMETRFVQTNEVRRSAILLPAMQMIQEREQDNPLSLVEVGASAGLLLLLDQYGYDYGDHGRFGREESQLQLECEIRGKQIPPLRKTQLVIGERTGIDLNPVDVTDPDEALWLRALVWADQPERLERLRRAISIVADRPPRLIAGDALDVLPMVLNEADATTALCVFHCHTLNQFSADGREQFTRILAEQSTRRVVYEVALESYASAARGELILSIFEKGELADQKMLGRYGPHGQWLEWLQAATP